MVRTVEAPIQAFGIERPAHNQDIAPLSRVRTALPSPRIAHVRAGQFGVGAAFPATSLATPPTALVRHRLAVGSTRPVARRSAGTPRLSYLPQRQKKKAKTDKASKTATKGK